MLNSDECIFLFKFRELCLRLSKLVALVTSPRSHLAVSNIPSLSTLYSHSLDNSLKVEIIRREITFKVGITLDSQGLCYDLAWAPAPRPSVRALEATFSDSGPPGADTLHNQTFRLLQLKSSCKMQSNAIIFEDYESSFKYKYNMELHHRSYKTIIYTILEVIKL